jgi:hypothetical protein
MFNKNIDNNKYEKNVIKVDSRPDSRIEMMGGGYKEKES